MNTIETGPSNNARDSEVWSRSWTDFRVDRRSPRYCHVTFDHPPINTITTRRISSARFRRPATLAQAARLRELGLNTDGEFERSLGGRLVESLPDA